MNFLKNCLIFINQINNNLNFLHSKLIILCFDHISFEAYAHAYFLHLIYLDQQNTNIRKGTNYLFKFIENFIHQNFRY